VPVLEYVEIRTEPDLVMTRGPIGRSFSTKFLIFFRLPEYRPTVDSGGGAFDPGHFSMGMHRRRCHRSGRVCAPGTRSRRIARELVVERNPQGKGTVRGDRPSHGVRGDRRSLHLDPSDGHPRASHPDWSWSSNNYKEHLGGGEGSATEPSELATTCRSEQQAKVLVEALICASNLQRLCDHDESRSDLGLRSLWVKGKTPVGMKR